MRSKEGHRGAVTLPWPSFPATRLVAATPAESWQEQGRAKASSSGGAVRRLRSLQAAGLALDRGGGLRWP